MVDLDTSKLVLIFPWHTATNARAQPSQCIFGGNLELQVCSKSVIFNEP